MIEMQPITRAWLRDTLERAFWTFLSGALSLPLIDSFGWVEIADGEIWKAMAAGGIGSVVTFAKSIAAKRLSEGDTAQLGAKTYSYTEAGPGSAGADL